MDRHPMFRRSPAQRFDEQVVLSGGSDDLSAAHRSQADMVGLARYDETVEACHEVRSGGESVT